MSTGKKKNWLLFIFVFQSAAFKLLDLHVQQTFSHQIWFHIISLSYTGQLMRHNFVFFHIKVNFEWKRRKLLAGTWRLFVLENRKKRRQIFNVDVGFLFCMLVIYEKRYGIYVVMRVNQCHIS